MKIVIPAQGRQELRQRIALIAPEAKTVAIELDGQADGPLEDAEAMFVRWEMSVDTLRRILPQMPHLRWLHTPSAGVDRLMFPELLSHPCVLTNSVGVYSIPIAEHVLAIMLAVARQLPLCLQQQREHRWQRVPAVELYEETVAIIGTGHIGQEVARRAQALGMHTLGTRRQPRPTSFIEQVFPLTHLYDMLAQADFVVITCPLTPETAGMIGEPELQAMKKTAWLINVARGGIVQEKALLRALREGWIAGAGLDTFVQEPLPEDSPFWDLPNVILTPHTSWSSPQVRERTIALFLENLERFLAGEPLLNVVDKKRGY